MYKRNSWQCSKWTETCRNNNRSWLAKIQVCLDGFYLQYFLNLVSRLVQYTSSLHFSPGFISFPVHLFTIFLYAPYVSPLYLFPYFLILFLNLFPESYFLLVTSYLSYFVFLCFFLNFIYKPFLVIAVLISPYL